MRTLTRRESEVLERLASTGESNGEIATDLGISEKTVRTYMRNIGAALDIHTRGRLIVYAWETGWIQRRLAERSAA